MGYDGPRGRDSTVTHVWHLGPTEQEMNEQVNSVMDTSTRERTEDNEKKGKGERERERREGERRESERESERGRRKHDLVRCREAC